MPKRSVDDILASIPTRASVHPGQESRVDRALRTLDPDHSAALRKVTTTTNCVLSGRRRHRTG